VSEEKERKGATDYPTGEGVNSPEEEKEEEEDE
jgi:hypothetical protein